MNNTMKVSKTLERIEKMTTDQLCEVMGVDISLAEYVFNDKCAFYVIPTKHGLSAVGQASFPKAFWGSDLRSIPESDFMSACMAASDQAYHQMRLWIMSGVSSAFGAESAN